MHQILPNVFTFTGLLAGRVYALQDADGITLIDSSLEGAAPKILAQLSAAGHAPTHIKRILITHAHPDHIGSLSELHAASGAPIYAHPLEQPTLQGEQPVPRRAGGFTMPTTYIKTAVTVHELLNDGDELPILGGLRALHTPGHAPGHLSFWLEQHKLIITGDTIFHLPHGMTLPFFLFTVDTEENKRSIAKLVQLQPEALLFGHGTPILTDTRTKLNLFARRVGAI